MGRCIPIVRIASLLFLPLVSHTRRRSLHTSSEAPVLQPVVLIQICLCCVVQQMERKLFQQKNHYTQMQIQCTGHIRWIHCNARGRCLIRPLWFLNILLSLSMSSKWKTHVRWILWQHPLPFKRLLLSYQRSQVWWMGLKKAIWGVSEEHLPVVVNFWWQMQKWFTLVQMCLMLLQQQGQLPHRPQDLLSGSCPLITSKKEMGCRISHMCPTSTFITAISQVWKCSRA